LKRWDIAKKASGTTTTSTDTPPDTPPDDEIPTAPDMTAVDKGIPSPDLNSTKTALKPNPVKNANPGMGNPLMDAISARREKMFANKSSSTSSKAGGSSSSSSDSSSSASASSPNTIDTSLGIMEMKQVDDLVWEGGLTVKKYLDAGESFSPLLKANTAASVPYVSSIDKKYFADTTDDGKKGEMKLILLRYVKVKNHDHFIRGFCDYEQSDGEIPELKPFCMDGWEIDPELEDDKTGTNIHKLLTIKISTNGASNAWQWTGSCIWKSCANKTFLTSFTGTHYNDAKPLANSITQHPTFPKNIEGTIDNRKALLSMIRTYTMTPHHYHMNPYCKAHLPHGKELDKRIDPNRWRSNELKCDGPPKK